MLDQLDDHFEIYILPARTSHKACYVFEHKYAVNAFVREH